MKKLWKGLCDVRVPRKFLDNGNVLAFVWVITWAENEAAFAKKARALWESHDGELLAYDELEAIEPDSDHSELNDLIDEARDNPEAVLFGTFHSYPDD
jgi:hypothetical protein